MRDMKFEIRAALVLGTAFVVLGGISAYLWTQLGASGSSGQMLQGAIQAVWYLTCSVLALWAVDLIQNLLTRQSVSSSTGPRFRKVLIPSDPDWVVFSAGLFSASTALLFLAFTREGNPLYPRGNDWQGALIPIMVIGFSAALVTWAAVNMLRYLQFSACLRSGIPPSLHLCEDVAELSTDFVSAKLKEVYQSTERAIKENYTDLTVFISRDDQAAREMGWSVQFVNKIRNPVISSPPDVFSIDSQVSIRSIYPASLRFWSAQIRRGTEPCKVLHAEPGAGEALLAYRTALTRYLQTCIDRAWDNFRQLNANGDCADTAEAKLASISQDRAHSVRLLIFEPKVLESHAINAVIEFHEAANMPLFYVPNFYIRGVSEAEFPWADHWPEVRVLCNLYARVQDCWRRTELSIWNPCAELLPDSPKKLGPLWRAGSDDFVIVDDAAWRGYPAPRDGEGESTPPVETDPLPLLQKYLYMIGLPHVLLAVHASALIGRARRAGGPLTMRALYDWWARGCGVQPTVEV